MAETRKARMRQRIQKRKVKRQMFDGGDWVQLLRVFGIKDWAIMRHACDHEQAAYLRLRLENLSRVVTQEFVDAQTRKQIHECRRWMRMLAKASRRHHYDAKVWEAVADIEDDWTFLQWLGHMLEWAWV